jgi:AraC-like DNA-binding protein
MFGTTPGQDMIRGKMDHAKSLLLVDEYMPLATIAERLGYSSQYHFIRQFKQITGETPGAYRRKNK